MEHPSDLVQVGHEASEGGWRDVAEVAADVDLAQRLMHEQLADRPSRLRLLRAHGVIHKIPKTHRYRLTLRGQLLTAALQATPSANIKDLSSRPHDPRTPELVRMRTGSTLNS
jgi:hypothetical protein